MIIKRQWLPSCSSLLHPPCTDMTSHGWPSSYLCARLAMLKENTKLPHTNSITNRWSKLVQQLHLLPDGPLELDRRDICFFITHLSVKLCYSSVVGSYLFVGTGMQLKALTGSAHLCSLGDDQRDHLGYDECWPRYLQASEVHLTIQWVFFVMVFHQGYTADSTYTSFPPLSVHR